MPADAHRVHRLVIAVVAVVVLVPAWASPVLVTTDGASHVYNAAVTDAVAAARPPYAALIAVDRDRTRPNQATQVLLGALGPAVGWETAERVVFTLAVAATLAALLALLAGSGAPTLAALAPAAGWLAQSWFLWMGFYDFALSLALYAGLVLLLERESTPRRRILVQAIFAVLYFTHVLTLAVAAGLTLAVAGWRAATGRGR
ncbi:MAG: hypothetical protein ACREMJ_04000, partial [Gemmatimonadales bacterium]